jgi:uncharacterized protein HemY
MGLTLATLGNVLRDQGKLDAAEAAYRRSIALMPAFAHTHLCLGDLLAKRKRWTEAATALRKTIELSPGNVEAQNGLAWLLATCPEVKLRDPGQAVRHARKAAELAPNQGGVWNTLGVALYRNGDWKAAVEALAKSVQLGKGGGGVDFFFLAMAHWQLQETDQARAWYEKGVAWMDKHKSQDAEMKGFRAEAAALLGLAKDAAPTKKQ